MTSSQHLFIESDANPRLKRWRRLALEAKAVRREGATVLEGIHLLQTVLEHPEVKINAVMLSLCVSCGYTGASIQDAPV